MADRDWPNLAAMFFAQARRRGDRPFLWAKRDGAYRSLGWRDAAAQVSDLARGLRALGLQRGDRVGLVSENRPEWVIADLAIISAGGVTVPAYTTHTVEDHRYLLANSGARAVIVSTSALGPARAARGRSGRYAWAMSSRWKPSRVARFRIPRSCPSMK